MILDELLKVARDPDILDERFRASTLVNIQPIADYYWQSPSQEWPPESFPNCAPPWPIFTMFWKRPARQLHPDGWHEDPRAARAEGAIVVSSKMDESMLPARWALRVTWLTDFPAFPASPAYMLSLHLIGADGRRLPTVPPSVPWRSMCEGMYKVIGRTAPDSDFSVGREGAVIRISLTNDAKQGNAIAAFNDSSIHTLLLAMSMCHCKNVSAVPVALPAAMVKARERRGRKPYFRYHTLQIDPMRKALESAGSGTVGLPKALHICRGHFKDFRDGRGLFGRYKGLFWWDQTLRGNRIHGEVAKTYEVLSEEGGAR